jgi:DNA-binding LytR/AlgR family response regulator
MKILIVDDEAPARRRLRRLLRKLGEWEVVGEARDGHEARNEIERLKPDVVFLDIDLPRLDGLALVATARELPPIVFVTAYNQFAVRAFEVGALDYVLKPIRSERLAVALERVRKYLDMRSHPLASELVSAIAARNDLPTAARLVCNEQGKLQIFDVRQISRFWASSKYTAFLCDGAEHLTDESLSVLEERLVALDFMRVHRGELVNLAHAQALVRRGGELVLELRDGQHAAVSRRRLTALREALTQRGKPA